MSSPDQTARQPCTVDVPYLLAINCELVRAPGGTLWADASWAKDLQRHLAYIPKLRMICAVRDGDPASGMAPVDLPPDSVVSFASSLRPRAFLVGLPRLVAALVREIRRASIVHTAIAGYPVPFGWFAVPIARLMGRRIVIIVESAPWRAGAGQRLGPKKQVMASVFEAMARACLRQADFAAYQHENYRSTLPSPRAEGGVLFQASWIGEDTIQPRGDVEARAGRLLAPGYVPRFLFAARLTPEKGTNALMAALDRLAGTSVDIDIIGAGPERETLAPLDGRALGRGHVRLLTPVPYGPAFLELLRGYDAILVPSLTDEQPRIVYDAASQGLGTIGSETAGLRSCVAPGAGRLVPAGDPQALAAAIAAAAEDPRVLRDWGLAALAQARAFTHESMHGERCVGLNRMLARVPA